MKTIKGDLIKLGKDGVFDVIVHGCNCFCTMGGGIAKSIRDNFPAAYEVDQQTQRGDRNKLGTISFAEIDNLIVVNAYTQYRYGRDKRHVDYDAVRDAFRRIKKQFAGKRIGYPRIGAGLAGGDWKVISKIIDEELDGENHTLVEWGKC